MVNQDYQFHANDAEDTRCVQACYQMVLSKVRGIDIPMHQAERETGYEPGLLTWQFAMLLSLADAHKLYVTDHEAFDVHRFIEDPIAMITEQIGDQDAAKHQIEHTDIDAEVARAKACVDHPRIRFIGDAPTWSDVRSVVEIGGGVILLVNGAALYDKPGYRPHSVVLRTIEADGSVIIDDPGPPPGPRTRFTESAVISAWLDPSPTVANYISATTNKW